MGSAFNGDHSALGSIFGRLNFGNSQMTGFLKPHFAGTLDVGGWEQVGLSVKDGGPKDHINTCGSKAQYEGDTRKLFCRILLFYVVF